MLLREAEVGTPSLYQCFCVLVCCWWRFVFDGGEDSTDGGFDTGRFGIMEGVLRKPVHEISGGSTHGAFRVFRAKHYCCCDFSTINLRGVPTLQNSKEPPRQREMLVERLPLFVPAE